MIIQIKEKDVAQLGSLNLGYENGIVTLGFGDARPIRSLSDRLPQTSGALLTDLHSLSWAEIEEIGLAGNARYVFALGARKKDYMKDGYVIEYQIIGFDHDDLADGTGKAPISWDAVRIYKEQWAMNSNGSNEGGWEDSEMNRKLNGDFLNLCSDELQAVIKPVIKLTSAGNRSDKIIKSKCKVWLKSEKELYGRTYYSFPGEGHWYEYYRQEDVPYFKEDDEGDKRYNSLRSPYYNTATDFCLVTDDGYPGDSAAACCYGVAPAFST